MNVPAETSGQELWLVSIYSPFFNMILSVLLARPLFTVDSLGPYKEIINIVGQLRESESWKV